MIVRKKQVKKKKRDLEKLEKAEKVKRDQRAEEQKRKKENEMEEEAKKWVEREEEKKQNREKEDAEKVIGDKMEEDERIRKQEEKMFPRYQVSLLPPHVMILVNGFNPERIGLLQRLVGFKQAKDKFGVLDDRRSAVNKKTSVDYFISLRHFNDEKEAKDLIELVDGLSGGWLGDSCIRTELREIKEEEKGPSRGRGGGRGGVRTKFRK